MSTKETMDSKTLKAMGDGIQVMTVTVSALARLLFDKGLITEQELDQYIKTEDTRFRLAYKSYLEFVEHSRKIAK